MAILEGASNLVVNISGNVIERQNSTHTTTSSSTGSGIKVLLDASYPEAAYDSSSHPTSCFPGTRLLYIDGVAEWSQLPLTEHRPRMMWMQGPAGVGKSAVAQSCSERVGTKLAASFFFSRPHSRDLSTRLFPSIAYQLTRKYPAYRDKLDKILSEDPTLVDKSMAVQFRELIVIPVQELQDEKQKVEEGVVLIDGLDKCAGEDAQCTIIDIVSTSVRNNTTPFIWAFFSRPEPRIVAEFDASSIRRLCWRIKLPVSHDADEDIALYLKDAFKRIRAQHDIPSVVSWPSEDDIKELVRRSAGLFIYPTSVVRYVEEGGPLGPEEQLRLVLQVPSKVSGNPWSHLDAFYTLIMEQIPKEMLPNTLELLLFHRYVPAGMLSSVVAATVLDYSLSTYSSALSKLHSVVKLKRDSHKLPKAIRFYHASFTEFLDDPERSGPFCFAKPELCAVVLTKAINHINKGFRDVILAWEGDNTGGGSSTFSLQDGASGAFWRIGSRAKLDEDLLRQLSQCDYRNMGSYIYVRTSTMKRFFDNIPPRWRAKIMRPYYFRFWHRLLQTGNPTNLSFILGNGGKRGGLKPLPERSLVQTCDYKDLRPFRKGTKRPKPLRPLPEPQNSHHG